MSWSWCNTTWTWLPRRYGLIMRETPSVPSISDGHCDVQLHLSNICVVSSSTPVVTAVNAVVMICLQLYGASFRLTRTQSDPGSATRPVDLLPKMSAFRLDLLVISLAIAVPCPATGMWVNLCLTRASSESGRGQRTNLTASCC